MSRYQLLPLDIVERIVNYHLDTYGASYSSNKLTALALLHSCHHWRHVFIETAFDHLYLSSESDTPYLYFSRCPDWINPFFYPLDRLVKQLNISLSHWGELLFERANDWINTSGFATMRLNRLYLLKFKVQYAPFEYYSELQRDSKTIRRVVSFFVLLRQIVPSVRRIEAYGRYAFKWPLSDDAVSLPAEKQVLGLLRSVRTMKFDCHNVSTYLKNPAMFANNRLTCLDYTYSSNVDTVSFLEVLRLNAANVVSVAIDCLPLSCVKDIIKSDDGEPVIYLRIRWLNLTNIYRDNDPVPPSRNELIDISPGTIHFPALEIFDFSHGLYPFNDNFMSCGLNDTLERLKISFITSDISKDPVQSILSTQLVNLKKITLISYNVSLGEASTALVGTQQYTSIAQFLRTLLRPASGLEKLDIFIPAESPLYLEELLCLKFEFLRYLNLSCAIFSFSEVLHIVQKVHYLERLTCKLDENPPAIERVRSVRLPRYMEDCGPINSHFFELRVGSCSRETMENHIKSAVLLAIGCPNFAVIVFRTFHPSEIQFHIKELLKTSVYKKYVDVGKRLLVKIGYISEIYSNQNSCNMF